VIDDTEKETMELEIKQKDGQQQLSDDRRAHKQHKTSKKWIPKTLDSSPKLSRQFSHRHTYHLFSYLSPYQPSDTVCTDELQRQGL